MKKPVTIKMSIRNLKGTIELSHLKREDKVWLADALMDSFVVDDAYYSTNDRLIHVQNWESDINAEAVRRELPTLLRERLYDDLVFCDS